MIVKFIYFFFAIILCVFADPPAPFWGGNPIFSTKMHITIHNKTYDMEAWTATYYYNTNLKAERYEYDEGQMDQMCWASGTKFWQKNKCNVIYASDGYIYVEFPTQSYCCQCTNSFGAVKYDWLQNSKYVGRETINGTQADHWVKDGNPNLGPMPNNYWATVGEQLPVRFYENSTSQYKDIVYDLSTYKKGPLDNSLFAPPANCKTQCPGFCQQIKSSKNLNKNLKIE